MGRAAEPFCLERRFQELEDELPEFRSSAYALPLTGTPLPQRLPEGR